MLEKIIEIVLKILRAFSTPSEDTSRKLGQQEQQTADLTALHKHAEEAREVERNVDAASDAQLDELRDKWTAPGSTRPGPRSE